MLYHFLKFIKSWPFRLQSVPLILWTRSVKFNDFVKRREKRCNSKISSVVLSYLIMEYHIMTNSVTSTHRQRLHKRNNCIWGKFPISFIFELDTSCVLKGIGMRDGNLRDPDLILPLNSDRLSLCLPESSFSVVTCRKLEHLSQSFRKRNKI